jgi:hypothetical protein
LHDTTQREAATTVARIKESKKLDGVVDDAQYPEDRSAVHSIFEKYNPTGADVYRLELELKERFNSKQAEYQTGFSDAIKNIFDGCRKIGKRRK